MNKLVLVLIFIAFSGTNVLAAGLPTMAEVKLGADLSKCNNANHLELTSTNFADPPPEPPNREVRN